jgi:hypothetical protein
MSAFSAYFARTGCRGRFTLSDARKEWVDPCSVTLPAGSGPDAVDHRGGEAGGEGDEDGSLEGDPRVGQQFESVDPIEEQ